MEKRAVFELSDCRISNMDKFADCVWLMDRTASIIFKADAFRVECTWIYTDTMRRAIRLWTGVDVEPKFIGGNNERAK